MLLRSLSRSVTKQIEDKRVKQQMAEAVARYDGPITHCPPARARGSEWMDEEPMPSLARPRFDRLSKRWHGRRAD
jgi:hypothetical protein